jgi:hypothetical protein
MMIAHLASVLAGLGERAVWAVDTEFQPGPPFIPVCLCARNLLTGEELRIWRYNPKPPHRLPPIPCPFGLRDILVVHNAVAEASFFVAENWPIRRAFLIR